MPTSVVAAVAASAVSEYVVGAAIFETVLANQILGAVAGGLTSMAVNAAFSDSSDTSQGQQQFVQELRDNLVTVRQPISHWRYIYGRDRVPGALTFMHESADDKLHIVITFAGHVCEEIEAIQFNDEVVPLDVDGNATGRYAGYVRIKKSLGAEAGQPFPDLVAESEGKWTDTWRQSGRTKIYVRLTFSPDIFPTGLPNITAIIKGKKVYDPRTATEVWSDNASLCQADFLCDAPAGLGSVYAVEIDEPQLIAAANIDDEPVNLAAGGTEKRYTLNGSFFVNAEPRTPLGRMLTANAGKARYIGGVWRLHPAAYATPTITLNEGDVRAVPHITPRLSGADLANGVKGLYVSEDNYWQSTDFPPITNATYLAEDEGERSWRELDLPFTKSAATAQRIAKIELEQVRQQIGVDWPGKFTCYRLQPGDTVKLDFTLLGWSEKVFEVEQAGLVFEEDDGIRIGCDMVLRETASSVFDWNSGEETIVDPAPDTNLPDPYTVAAPGTPDVAEALFETTGSAGVKARATMSWAAVTDAFVRDYLPEYRVAGGAWVVLPASAALAIDINDIAPGQYEFRVRARNSMGVSSAYSATRAKEILGLTAPPADITGLGIQAAGGLAILTFALHPDLDVRQGGAIRARHSPSLSGATWETSTGIGEAGAGTATVLVLPLKAGTYLLKAEDSGGRPSVTAASISTKQATALAWSTLSSVQEDDDFLGTHSSTYVDGVDLQLGSDTLFDAATGNFDDAAGLFDYFGGVAAAGTYDFAAGMDLGVVSRVRLTSLIAASAVNVSTSFDETAGLFDDAAGLFDGTEGAPVDAWVEARETDDDPAGTPTWSAWKRLDAAEFVARGFDFRARLTSGDLNYTIKITQLRVAAEQIA
jgi:hypothetical protein